MHPESPVFTLRKGSAPLLISIPHLGTELPPGMAEDLTPAALKLADTDWHLDRLYADMADALGASVLVPRFSRYVIDLNRPSSGQSLYPGQTTTGLCPTSTFRGEAVYLAGREPAPQDIQRRIAVYWQPYQDALHNELQRLRSQHSQVLLWEAHSIASVLPHLFEGKLPDVCLGTNDGASADAGLLDAVVAPVRAQSQFSQVVNGRFKGGYNTRHHGVPATGIHAIQLEMCQSLYMNEDSPFDYREAEAARFQPLLQQMLGAAVDWLNHPNSARR